jgi:hypothetical protein
VVRRVEVAQWKVLHGEERQVAAVVVKVNSRQHDALALADGARRDLCENPRWARDQQHNVRETALMKPTLAMRSPSAAAFGMRMASPLPRRAARGLCVIMNTPLVGYCVPGP